MDLVKAKEVLEVIEQLDPNSKESILSALNLAEHVEKTAGEFYTLEVKKTKGSELESFFAFMAREEDMHLAKILELKAQVQNGGEITKIGFPENAAPKIGAISAGQEEITAILYALWREKKAEDFYSKAAGRTDGNVRVFFEELAVLEKGHVELLEQYVELMQNADELIMG